MTTFGTPVSFIATANAEESRHFYESVLGLELLSDESYALVFSLGAIRLRVQKVETVPEVKHTVLGWNVVDIHKCVEELSDEGVQFEVYEHLSQDELGIWVSPSGASIAWFRDPDGNTLSLTEL